MYSVDGSMMIEGKVRESIYIVKNTYRRHAAHEHDRFVSPDYARHLKIVVAIVRSLLELLLVFYMPLASRD